MKKTLKIEGSVVPVKENDKFSLHLNDWLKALLIAIAAPVVDYLIGAISGGFEAIDWKHVLTVGVSAGLVYLAKNYLSPSTITIKKEDL